MRATSFLESYSNKHLKMATQTIIKYIGKVMLEITWETKVGIDIKSMKHWRSPILLHNIEQATLYFIFPNWKNYTPTGQINDRSLRNKWPMKFIIDRASHVPNHKYDPHYQPPIFVTISILEVRIPYQKHINPKKYCGKNRICPVKSQLDEMKGMTLRMNTLTALIGSKNFPFLPSPFYTSNYEIQGNFC